MVDRGGGLGLARWRMCPTHDEQGYLGNKHLFLSTEQRRSNHHHIPLFSEKFPLFGHKHVNIVVADPCSSTLCFFLSSLSKFEISPFLGPIIFRYSGK